MLICTIFVKDLTFFAYVVPNRHTDFFKKSAIVDMFTLTRQPKYIS